MTSRTDTGKHRQHEVFSASRAAHLDTPLRRALYRPDRLAEHLVKPGDLVLDFGCGPGFFTREFAKRVGETGRVYAVDLQEEMLGIVRNNMEAESLINRVTTHQRMPDSLNLPPDLAGTFDAAFAIFVVHEVPDPEKLFGEIKAHLKPGGTLFFSEPPIIVPGGEFRGKVALLEKMGFRLIDRSWFFLNRAAVLKKPHDSLQDT